ncbi:ABC transporter permease [Fulvivirga lutimaris]|uniref:ABC transporter permease n=1 Tax=Fulvivirga lutimaris TaxID=1819566 RepID=UPI0012BB8FFA|nr:ABC transporter permease [Fulvivirga lutimaris]MTI40741.1 ABC transporter permease [Fulvivirga lutimaris]
MEKFSQAGPPAFAKRLLQWYCKPELIEMIEGDIEEEFYNRVERQGLSKARLIYIMDVLRFFKPFAIKQFFKTNHLTMGLNFNYLKVAARSLKKDKQNLFVSITGLTVALACAIVIYTVIDFQINYDTFHINKDNVYRIIYDETNNPSSDRKIATVGPPVGPAIVEAFPEVVNSARLRYTPNQIVKYKNNQFYEEKIYYADPSLIEIFSFPLSKGNPNTALKEKNGIVLTEPMAIKYFGNENPLGKILEVGEETLEVTGVFAPIPKNNHFPFDFIRPFEAFEVPYGYPVTLDDWGWISFPTYIQLADGTDPNAFEPKLVDFAGTHFLADRIDNFRYGLQNLTQIYFGDVYSEHTKSGNYNYVYALGSVGLLILLLAGFNFTNITTAKSLTRATETGIRKTLGTSKKSLWWRYILEPAILVLGSLLVAFIISPYLLSWCAQVMSIDYIWNSELAIKLIYTFIPISFLIILLSGIYPAFIMSSFKPVDVLKGTVKLGNKGSWMRSVLVTIQFSITSILIIGSLIINGQVDYLLNKDLGYQKNQIALLQMPGETLQRYFEPLKERLLQIPEVKGASIGGGRMDGDTGSGPVSAEGIEEPVRMDINAVGDDFFKTIGVDMIAGREFSQTNAYDSANGIVINEQVAKAFGWTPEEALGKKIQASGQRNGAVIGVVSNFHFQSLHNEIKPLVLIYPHTRLRNIYLRVDAQNFHNLVVSVESAWKDIIPEVPFDFVFLDDHLQSLYTTDRQFSSLIKVFSVITIVIATIGLFGLISLVSQFRMKEIGIRKVLGASVNSIVFILSKNFILLILVANLITWPIIYYFSSSWMDTFAYQQGFDLSFYFIGLMLTLFVALLTLFIQTFKSATRNPINVIRMD